eukprot:6199266-Pleurochrysis_carterae.AAC.4
MWRRSVARLRSTRHKTQHALRSVKLEALVGRVERNAAVAEAALAGTAALETLPPTKQESESAPVAHGQRISCGAFGGTCERRGAVSKDSLAALDFVRAHGSCACCRALMVTRADA